MLALVLSSGASFARQFDSPAPFEFLFAFNYQLITSGNCSFKSHGYFMFDSAHSQPSTGVLIDSLLFLLLIYTNTNIFSGTQLCNSIIFIASRYFFLCFSSFVYFFPLGRFSIKCFSNDNREKVHLASSARAEINFQFFTAPRSPCMACGSIFCTICSRFAIFFITPSAARFSFTPGFFCAPEKLLICVYFRNFASFVSA